MFSVPVSDEVLFFFKWSEMVWLFVVILLAALIFNSN